MGFLEKEKTREQRETPDGGGFSLEGEVGPEERRSPGGQKGAPECEGALEGLVQMADQGPQRDEGYPQRMEPQSEGSRLESGG